MQKKLTLQKGTYKIIKHQIDVGAKHVNERSERYVMLMDTVTDRVKDRFRSNMKRKGPGWSGTLELDADNQELIIKVTRPEDVRSLPVHKCFLISKIASKSFVYT